MSHQQSQWVATCLWCWLWHFDCLKPCDYVPIGLPEILPFFYALSKGFWREMETKPMWQPAQLLISSFYDNTREIDVLCRRFGCLDSGRWVVQRKIFFFLHRHDEGADIRLHEADVYLRTKGAETRSILTTCISVGRINLIGEGVGGWKSLRGEIRMWT